MSYNTVTQMDATDMGERSWDSLYRKVSGFMSVMIGVVISNNFYFKFIHPVGDSCLTSHGHQEIVNVDIEAPSHPCPCMYILNIGVSTGNQLVPV